MTDAAMLRHLAAHPHRDEIVAFLRDTAQRDRRRIRVAAARLLYRSSFEPMRGRWRDALRNAANEIQRESEQ